MSAAPQRIRPTAPATRPRPKLVFKPRPYHWDRDRGRAMEREEVVRKYERSKWAGRALYAHLYRVTNGRAQAAWISFVAFHSKWSNDAKERKGEWSPVLLPCDAALECGLSEEALRVASQECVALGFTPRKGEEGEDFYRYQVDLAAMAKAPRATEPREGAFGRKPPARETEGVDEAKGDAESESCGESKPTRIGPLFLPAGKKVASKDLAMDLHNHTKQPMRVEAKTTLAGKVRLDFFSHTLGEAPAVTNSDRSSSEAKPDSGLGKIVGVIASADSTVAPGHPMLPFSDDPLIAGLAELGLPPEDKILAELRKGRRCELSHFLDEVRGKIKRLKPGETISQLILPRLLEQANQTWRNGGELRWRKQQALEAEEHAATSQGTIEEAPAPKVNSALAHSLEELRYQLKEAKARGGQPKYIEALNKAIAVAEAKRR